MRLRDKVVIVTGGGRGIGEAICKKLADEGARVVVADLILENAASTAEAIASRGGQALAVKVDVTKRVDVEAMVEQAKSTYGRIDVLVNNAGWDKVEPFLDSDEETWDKVISINLKGVLYTCKLVLPLMIEQGYGKVVNISSDAGRVGSSGEAVYSAAKGGVIAFSKTLAREMARYKINVNVVCPGPANTPLFEEITSYNPKISTALEKAIPFRRLAEPMDIANAVCYFASDEASYVTGQTLSVSGGLTMA
ncbi:SDR family NAD(P)-dependent oxidoreductase [Kyrpidia tusciae]|uniref:Short-chain dehydrogenase/reductase SDR n=1 Tax=Kyrpidia tusciae (strain DSM 2912 / NBRC 15312 / T2) TaxID=562970 RepID=D5WXU4_KYRT2|nr:SDR family NAD(P)-dependent oxidoreductase [Kyrpidia tusciae]ADG06003.1 short-chain dehydrogenase/reductase SDR [Kyrpidia tusciae DSM 2912]